jgi:hypothetical protein
MKSNGKPDAWWEKIILGLIYIGVAAWYCLLLKVFIGLIKEAL